MRWAPWVAFALIAAALVLGLGLPAVAARLVHTDAGPAYLYTPHETRAVRAYIQAQAEEIERLRVQLEQRCLQ